MPPYTAKLASLIASRICHDLISPVGAISNGLELMSLAGAAPSMGPELSLVTDSCEQANARIRFFRIAYGAASDSAQLSRHEVVTVLTAMAATGRVLYHWLPEGDLSRREVQLAFLTMQCIEAALPRGGEITFHYAPGHWEISAEAERVSLDTALWDQMARTAAAPDAAQYEPHVPPNQVQFALLPLLARDAGRRPSVEATSTQITLTV